MKKLGDFMAETAVSVEDLKVKFPNEKSFLFKDFSLSVTRGEKVLLVGPSGAGKSTLLKILAGIIPNSVEVPMKCTDCKLPNRYGYVFQDPDSQFCMPYVDEEIAFVLENTQIPPDDMPTLIKKYLDDVCLSLPDIHTKIDRLSGGMKQRLAIASVLALQPDVLFLDEPTAMLDEEGTKQVWDTVMNIASDKTVIIVEHKIEQVFDFVDRIIMINSEGSLVASGEPEVMVHQCKYLFSQYGVWYPSVWQEKLKNDKQCVEVLLPEVTIQQLKGYKNKKELIRVEEVTVNRGDWVVITGDNGSGKSTLLQALAKLIKTKGEISYSMNNDSNYYGYMGYVFQNPELQFITDTVYEELAFSLRNSQLSNDECDRRIMEQLNIFQLDHVKEKHPFQLSVGQMKRLSIAAIAITRPQILLLDEPTFGQDAANTFRMLDYFASLHRSGMTILMVTHDKNIREHYANTEWKIRDGMLTDARRLYETDYHSDRMGVRQSVMGT
ncbi:energy-coupling factor transport system ATP-binding protein [Gracilibacillus ureilyticus]|uniref:Energy-coupling factor transport system ATP-binding protein n=1 Tax=Gracilibacillus ureilyticus TaxID=531814 RepID=A0A1H9LIT2_9BACI|nr:ABC transporter ATP-binding protein [Gracilibacillus ureilyticus]SER11117.1 energy-coupling factor transport system ATP-binding protein [Gracilibacillus ureilyticus]